MKLKFNGRSFFLWVCLALGASLLQGFSQTNVTCDPPPTGITGWWQAEGSAAEVVGGSTGLVYSGVTYASGVVGEAFSFDGTNGCVMNTNTPAYTNIQNSFTMEFWAYPQKGFVMQAEGPDGLANSGQSFAIFPDWGGYNGQAGVGVCVGTNGITVMEHAYNYLPSLLSYTNLINGWVHVAVVYNNKLPLLYVNGVLVQTGIASTRTFVYPSKNFGGSYDIPAGAEFNFQGYGPYAGLMDEISIYNRALSANEIQAVYAAGSSGKCYTGTPPTLTSQPTNETVDAGGTTTFSITAGGSPQLGFQWSFDGTNISGATNRLLTLAGVQAANTGTYQVAVTNLYGSAISSNATLMVLTFPPVIASQPTNQFISANSSVTFSVTATGSPQLNYQWSLNGTNLSGATNLSLTLTDVQAVNSGIYQVAVTNLYGSAISSNATLTVLPAPPCDPPPSGIVDWWSADGNAADLVAGGAGKLYPGTSYTNGMVGEAFRFDGVYGCVMNTNTPSLTSIQNTFTMEFWAYPQKGFTILPQGAGMGLSGQSFAIFPDYGGTAGQAGVGVCVGTNGISVLEHAYNYLPSLLSYTNLINGWVHVAVVYINKQSHLYVNGVLVRTGVTSTRTYVYPSKSLGGAYDLGYPAHQTYGPYKGFLDEVSIYNRALSAGEVQAIYAAGSNGKCYTGTPPLVSTQPASQTVNASSKVTLSVTASGSPQLNYQWSLNGINLSGATNTSLTLTNVQAGNAGVYQVMVTNNFGSATSSNAVLTVLTFPPVLASQPVSQTVNAGSNVTFSVAASGSPQLNYQWSFNGTNISGATTTSLTLVGVQAANAGTYVVTVTNLYGSAASSNAVLTVLTHPPVLTSQPPNQTVAANGGVTFSVTASGSPQLNYQWSFNGTNLSGATNGSVTLFDVQSVNAGVYQVTVTNLYGSALSSNAVLTVLPPPPCVPPPSGVVDWWPADGNATDIIIGEAGTLYPGTGYTNGMAGEAFSFDGIDGCVMNTNTPSLTDILDTFTMEFWAYPQQGFLLLPEGAGMGISDQSFAIFPEDGGDNGLAGAGVSVGTNGICVEEHASDYLPSLLSYTNSFSGWVHVAVVYTNKQPSLYVNGVLVRTGVISTQTHVYPSKNLGNSYDLSDSAHQYYGPYKGFLDEVSIYNRALSAGEIQAIYAASSGGKCIPSEVPIITAEPTNETVGAGGSVTFNVAAAGLPQLNYQWSFNGTNISGATNTSLTLANVRMAESGLYLAIVTNSYGSVTSSNAALTVVPPPGITQQPQSLSVVSFNRASFSVAATGVGPLSYQWLKNGTNLTDNINVSGSATAILTLAVVSAADAGNYEVAISNPYATTNSAVAVLTVPETVIDLGSENAMSGTTVTVPVWMNALGVETIFTGSVGYDPTKLVFQGILLGSGDSDAYVSPNTTQTNNGNVGFAISFSPVVPAGNQEVAQLVFQALPVTNTTNVTLTFGDTPTPRQLVANDANLDSLPFLCQNSTVTLTPAEYEADVYPRFGGDHVVNAQDWAEVGRMVAGLDVPTNSDELLRADCAPRNAPDGVLAVADWVQAGRYALGLDPLTLVPSPNSDSNVVTPEIKAHPLGVPEPVRILQVASVFGQRGQTVSVPVQLICTTNENAIGLTVNYNPALLKLTGVTLGTNMAGGRFNINSNLVVGKVGLALALTPGQSLTAGTNQVAVLQFVAATNAVNTVALTLDGSLVVSQVADKTANVLAVSYVSGAVVFPSGPTVQASKSGGNLQLSWPVGSGTYQVLTANSLTGPWQPVTVVILTNGANATVSVSVTNQQQFYRLQGQ